MGLPFLSFPKATILPATWAPTSTSSSGSTVPVALTVTSRSPLVTEPDGRKQEWSFFPLQSQNKARTMRAAMISRAIFFQERALKRR